MNKRYSFFVAACVAALLSTSVSANAQRAGVAIDALTPAGMTRVDVVLPAHEHAPVRLGYALDGQTEPTLWLDVVVAESAELAGDVLDWQIETSSGELGAIANIGRRAVGDAEFVAFTRDNVFVVVRGQRALEHAQRIDGIVARSSRGTTRANALEVNRPSQLAPGTAELLRIEGAAHVRVVARGGALARNTRRGWVVAHRGEGGAYSLNVVWVDSRLRVGRGEF